MQDRLFAFVCSPFRGDMEANAEKAREYSRRVYEAGYTPLAPHLLFPQFLSEHDPAEREAGIQMGMELLAQCSLLVVCGDEITEGMAREVSKAKEFGIDACSLENIPPPYSVEAKPSLLGQVAAARANPTSMHPAKSGAPEL